MRILRDQTPPFIQDVCFCGYPCGFGTSKGQQLQLSVVGAEPMPVDTDRAEAATRLPQGRSAAVPG